MKTKYRVVWKREGQDGKRSVLFQTLEGASRCVRRQQTASKEMDWANVPPLVFGPIVMARDVGEWSQVVPLINPPTHQGES